MLLTAIGPRRRLWERRRHDADALTIRIGTGDVDSDVVLDDPDQLEHKREQTWTAHDVPVTVSLRERGVLGVAGQGDFPRAVARWVVAQVAVLHSPADLHIYVLTDAGGRESWQWLHWLPHARPAAGQDTVTLIGSDPDSTASRVAELVAIVAGRRSSTSPGTVPDEADVLVVLDGARRLRSLPGMVQVLREGPSVGVFAVCLDSDERLLPEECQAVVVQEATGVRVQQMRTDVVDCVRADLVSPAWCDRVARALAPAARRQRRRRGRRPCRRSAGCSTCWVSSRRVLRSSRPAGRREAAAPRHSSVSRWTGRSASTCGATARTV